MTLSFRVRLFVAFSLVAIVAAGTAAVLGERALAGQTVERIERGLISQARLAAELLGQSGGGISPTALDEEADRLGRIVEARVTFVASEGTVVGDSANDTVDPGTLENHGTRPEVVAALRSGLGISRRYSTTVRADLLYVAVPVRHPAIAVVRLAMPLTEIQGQVRAVRRAAAAALGAALAIALALAWLASWLLAARLRALAAAARRYADGDLSAPARTFGADEIGELGRALDESVHQLAHRMSDLEASRARTEAILAGMVEGVIVVDGHGRVQLLNDSARQVLGIDRSPEAGAFDGEGYLHVVRHPAVVAQFDAAMAGRQPDTTELVLPSGGTIAARAVPLAQGGAVLVLHDITRLRQADQIRRDFVANVSHELRTPLTAVRGYAEALRDDSLSAAERDRFLDIITRHADRMARLVQDLLRLARLEAGQEVVERAACDVAGVFETVVTDLQLRLEAKGQRIITAIAPDAGHVVTDGGKLEEMLKNLVENAIKYAPEGSEIRLEGTRRDGRFEITVSDQGPGIPPGDVTRVFERFYRVDKVRSRDSGGTGLGLSIVKHLAETLGGEVRAANRPEGGACFTVTL